MFFFFDFVGILSINQKIVTENIVPILHFFSIYFIKLQLILTVQECISAFVFFPLNILRLKLEKSLKCYHLFVLLSGVISLNPAPSQ